MRASARTSVAVRGIKIAAFSAGVLLLASCSSSPGSTETSAPAKSSAPAAAGPAADGKLTVNTILPQTGTLAFLGPPEEAGVQLAINDAKTLDLPFDIVVENRDSGDTTTDIATQSAREAVDSGADVVIGAASSGVSFTFIDAITGAGILQISPANTSPDFTDYDDNNFYWRTAPSDVLQGRVLGNLMVGDGNENIGMLVLNDPYGTGLADNAQKAIEAAGGTVTDRVTFNTGETQFAAQVNELLAGDPDAVAVIAFEETASIIPELVNTQGFDSSKVYFVDGNLSNSYDFPKGTLTGAKGTLPGNFASSDFQTRLKGVDDGLDDFSYAAESYDAVALTVLAALQGGDDAPATIRDNLQAVSEEGTKCKSMKECADLIADGTDIDYDGQSGPITFDAKGDPTQAYIGIYQYGADNKYKALNAEFGDLNG